MPTRRKFIAAAASIAATALPLRRAGAESAPAVARVRKGVPRIKAVLRRDETTVRHGGVGDNWHMTWAADGRQFVSLCDGYGWLDTPKGMFNSRLLAIDGDATDAVFSDTAGYPELIASIDAPRYYNFGTLALDGHIYQYLSTFSHPISAARSVPSFRFNGAKLIYSADNGRTWRNQDGSSPVAWEGWQDRSRKTLVFFEESQDAFSLLTVLQRGKNYEANRDGYVYVYAPNGSTEGTMNQLVMFRVPEDRILNRSAYEYFAGLGSRGGARWVRDIDARGIVHTFPSGWVNTTLHPYAWHPSVVYDAPLCLYIMANWGMGCASDGGWFGKPSYLGLYTAPNPWGPWTQIHEEIAWTPQGDPQARAYQPQIAPAWIAPDGKSFWLVWTDFQTQDGETYDQFNREFATKRREGSLTDADWTQAAAMMRKHKPFYAFNVQRVDLVVA